MFIGDNNLALCNNLEHLCFTRYCVDIN